AADPGTGRAPARAGGRAAGDEGGVAGGRDRRAAAGLAGRGCAPAHGSRHRCGPPAGGGRPRPRRQSRIIPSPFHEARARMARIIAVANQKGGGGKTALAIHLAAALAGKPKRVRLVDLDVQGKETVGSGEDKHEKRASSCDVMLVERYVAGVTVIAPEGYD